MRTLLKPVWMRDHRWWVRERADHLASRVFALAGGALLMGAAALVLGWLGVVLLLPGLLYAAGLVWPLTRPGELTLVDFREGTVGSVPFRKVRALALETWLLARPNLSGPDVASQVWSLDVLRTDSSVPRRLAVHADELVLLRAARQLSLALGVPVLDHCGPEGEVSVWPPKPVPLRREQGPRKDGGIAGVPAASGGGSVRARVTPAGLELSWHARPYVHLFFMALCSFLLAYGVVLLNRQELRPFIVAILMGMAIVAWLFLLALRGTAARGINKLTVGRDVLLLRTPVPVPWVRRIPLGKVRGLRLSRLLAGQVLIGSGERPLRVAHTKLDVLGERGPLVRIVLSPAEAISLRTQLEAALAAQRA
ncbi:hypothetical protein JQX13_47740 [Archangium violaceum]|uniref:hypothetical protein n=1 Tax=Archangium violaceum TaxID=83451 RepID=UPI00193AE0C2|nr:hypothetical protein [Archangium violaceum]QRK07607.1 hypothetical protein JQX13_47740 [Archangium violaceum]